ncbi:unnamed protein product [Sphagnum balticum]
MDVLMLDSRFSVHPHSRRCIWLLDGKEASKPRDVRFLPVGAAPSWTTSNSGMQGSRLALHQRASELQSSSFGSCASQSSPDSCLEAGK